MRFFTTFQVAGQFQENDIKNFKLQELLLHFCQSLPSLYPALLFVLFYSNFKISQTGRRKKKHGEPLLWRNWIFENIIISKFLMSSN